MDRNKIIIKLSFQGIFLNLFLVFLKLLIGFLSSSIAIILDAINNFTDAISSIVTIIGTKIAQKPADRDHPFGHGRSEYLTSIIIAIIILYTGINSLIESINKIISPNIIDYSRVTFIILIIAIFSKAIFGIYLRTNGKKINAQALIASGTDALMDSFISVATLISAIIYLTFKINIDGYLGLLISLIILKTSFDILKEAMGSILGRRVESKFVTKVLKEINNFPEVLGAYDLMLHDYGPTDMIGSVRIEVRDQMRAREIDKLSRRISNYIFNKFGIILTIGIFAQNINNKEAYNIRKKVEQFVKTYRQVIQLHGFFISQNTKTVHIDLVFDYDCMHVKELVEEIQNNLHIIIPTYKFKIYPEKDSI